MIYLVDNSVLQRMRLPAVCSATESLIDADGELACCAATVDEASFSARNAAELIEIRSRLLGDFCFLEQDFESDRTTAGLAKHGQLRQGPTDVPSAGPGTGQSRGRP